MPILDWREAEDRRVWIAGVCDELDRALLMALHGRPHHWNTRPRLRDNEALLVRLWTMATRRVGLDPDVARLVAAQEMKARVRELTRWPVA